MNHSGNPRRSNNHYEDIEPEEGPVEEKSLPIRQPLVYFGKEKTHDIPQLVFEPSNYASEFFTMLSTMRDHNELCDVTLNIKGETIKAHKTILASCSPYFHAMFSVDMKESSSNQVTLGGCATSTAIKSLIDYCYSGSITITLDNVTNILPSASMFQMCGVVEACCNFLSAQLHPSNCLGIKRFADVHSCSSLLKKCNVFMRQRFPEVALHEEFLELSLKELVTIVSDSHLNIRGEEQIYEAAMAWTKHDLDNRQEHVGDIMKCVRMPLMSATYLSREVKNESLIMNSFVGRGLLIEAMDYHLQKHYMRDVAGGVSKSKLTTPRQCPGLNYLFAVGGSGPPDLDNPYLNLCECYSTEKNEWKTLAPFPRRTCGVRVANCGGYLFAIGGYSATNSKALATVDRYDPMSDSWRTVTSMWCPRRAFAVAVLNGYIYAIGGINGGLYYNSVERYCIKKSQWRFVQPMTVERRAVSATALDNYIYAAGGHDGENLLDSIERYDPNSDTWIVYAKLTSPRCLGALVSLKGFLYAVGGNDRFDGSSSLRTLQRYDPETEQWISLAPLSGSRSGFGATVMDGMLYVVGGCNEFTKVPSTDRYDPEQNQWTSVADMSMRRSGVGVAVASAFLI